MAMPETLSPPLKAVPLGKVASPQAMTEGVLPRKQPVQIYFRVSGRRCIYLPREMCYTIKIRSLSAFCARRKKH